MTQRARMVLAVLLLTLLTLGGAFGAVYISVDRAQQAQLDEALLAAARAEAGLLGSQADEALALSNRPGPAANQVGPLPTYAAVVGDRGQQLAMSPTLRALSGRSSLPSRREGLFDARLSAVNLRCVWLPIPGRPGAALFFAVPRADIDDDASILFRAMAMAFLVAVVWAAVVTTGIVRVFTDEHRRIADVARRVAAGDLSARINSRSTAKDTARFAGDLDAMIERLALLVSSQQRFIAYAAHELRSPLTMLFGELSLALRRSRTEEAYRAAITEALDATRRLTALSEDLLALARVSAVASAPQEEVLLVPLLEHACAPARAAAAKRGVTIEAVAEVASMSGRPLDLERLLRNLVDNAVQHTPDHSCVRVNVRAEGAVVLFSVEDAGAGVPEDERARIFEPFYRSGTTREREIPGSGLGLAIARDIARAHGGDIAVRAPEGGPGAVFVASLPRGEPCPG